ncbi:MAG: TrmH family RNA methyltransferase [Candidatus Izemoplasmataceae bacterium]
MITSVDNPTIKSLAKLQQKKYREQENAFIIEGEHLVETAQKNGYVKSVYAIEPFKKYPYATLVSSHVMKKITDAKNPPKIIALCDKLKEKPLSKKVLILEHIQDPGNLGTLLRSALAFGFNTVIIDECTDLYSPKVLRSTQGAIFDLSIRFMSTLEFIKNHKDYTIYATHVKTKKTPLNKPLDKLALILGNEGHGVKEETLNQSDIIISIPTAKVDSLNVAIAGSIIMHALSDDPFISK